MRAVRWGAVAGVVLLTAMSLAAAPAQAHNNTQHTSRICLLQLHRNTIGALDANSGTCDDDGYWVGRVRDSHATGDGHCVTVIMQGIRMADSCDSAGRQFTFRDPDGRGDANTNLCLANLSRCWSELNINF